MSTLSAPRTERTRHTLVVDAPAERLYDLIAQATDWPLFFAPNVHVDQLSVDVDENGSGSEQLAIWATANGEVKSWTSRRTLDRAAGVITFRQERSAPPVASMGGEWHFTTLSDGRTEVALLHDFRALDDDPEKIAWIHRAVDSNSIAELGGLAEVAARAGDARLHLDFEDSVQVAGRAQDVFAFLNEAGQWPQRLGHVAGVELTEKVPGQQLLRMHTRAVDGSTHTTTSIRVCTPSERIVYKQIEVPALMSAHIGEWRIRPEGSGVRVSSRHRVTLNPDTVSRVLGEQATLGTSAEFVRRALSTNSLMTLNHAKAFAENRADGTSGEGGADHDE